MRRILHRIIDDVEVKRCGTCHGWKPLTEFSPRRGEWDGLRCNCKACGASSRRRWADENPAKAREVWEQHYKVHADECCAAHRKWRNANPEKARDAYRRWLAQNPEKMKEACRQWRKENPHKTQEHNARRRARKKAANGADYTTAEHIAGRREVWGNRCYLCGAPAEAMDHVIPLARGGSHWPANLRPICRRCNSAKKDQWPYDIRRKPCGVFEQHMDAARFLVVDIDDQTPPPARSRNNGGML